MDFSLKLSWDADFSPVQNKEMIRRELGASSRAEFKRRFGMDYMHGICLQLWEKPMINWDGKVLGCPRNFWGDFGGNVFTDGLLESLNNEKINYARSMLTGREGVRDDLPCSDCEIFLSMKKEGRWLKRHRVRRLIVIILKAVKRMKKRLLR